jgi:hypothetical protein
VRRLQLGVAIKAGEIPTFYDVVSPVKARPFRPFRISALLDLEACTLPFFIG